MVQHREQSRLYRLPSSEEVTIMAGIDASIPLQAKTPDFTGRISDLINMQRDQTALKSEKQTQTQRQNLASFDYTGLFGEDGTIDLNRIPASGLREAAGDTYPDVLQKLIQTKQQQVQAKQSLVNLRGDERGAFGQVIGALRSDPDVAQDTPAGRQKVEEAIGQYVQMYPNAKSVADAYLPMLEKVPQGHLAQAVQNAQLQTTSADSQASRQAPQYTDTGSTLQQTNPYAQKGQAPDSIAVGVSPGSQESVVSDQLGNQYVMSRDARGNIVGTRPLSGGRSGTGGGEGGPAHFGVGERSAIEQQVDTNFKNIQGTRSAAQSAPQLLDQVHKARELASQVQTGAYSDKKQKLESAMGSFIPGFEGAKDDAAKYDLLNKFLTRISADSASVLGKNDSTDAARESIREQFGHTGQVNTAIGEVLKYTESQIAAVKAKADAQEKWLSTEGNGVRTQHQFETQWRQAYDPVVYQLEGADSAERKKIISGLSKEEAASLSEKRKKLREMGAL
jgi:hypothetical protein